MVSLSGLALGYLGPLVLGALLGVVIFSAFQPVTRWRYRHIPGPFGWPFIGNLIPFAFTGAHLFFDDMKNKHGRIFKVWLGSRVWVVVADPDLGRKVNLRNINRSLFPNISPSEHPDVDDAGLVVARAPLWKTLKLSWQPAFQPGSLEGYYALMAESTDKLVARLNQVASSGQVVDIWRELGNMTMQVVGSTAYGVDFHTLEEEDTSSSAAGRELVSACKTIFATASVATGSLYAPLAVVFPQLVPFIKMMARNFPDPNLRTIIKARDVITHTSLGLIKAWRDTHDDSAPDVVAVKDQGAGTANGVKEHYTTESNALPSKQASRTGVEPGSFIGLMLGARDKASGKGLNDWQVVASANTFLLAGYETTANTLAFSIYNLCCAPEAEAALMREIDAFGRHRAPELSDLDKFPYVEAVVKESLRLFPAGHMTLREAQDDMQLGKYHVPRGATLAVPIYTIHRDPDFWPQATDFLPQRFLPGYESLAARVPDAHIPFGGGPRMCIGHKFAMQEAKIALIKLYQSLHFELQPGQIPLKTKVTATLAPVGGVWVTVRRRD